MQTSTYSTVYHVIGNVPNTLKNNTEGFGLLSNKIVRIFSFIGEGMRRNPLFAATTFAIANLFIFLPIAHLIGSLINKRIHSHPEEMTADEEKMTKVVDCLSVGVTLFASNFFFSKLTKYPLSNLALLAIGTAAAASRAITQKKKKAKTVTAVNTAENKPGNLPEDKSKDLKVIPVPENKGTPSLNGNANITHTPQLEGTAMQIFVKEAVKSSESDQQITTEYSIESKEKISSLKEKIVEKTGIPKEQLRLVWAGSNLLDEKTLEDYSIPTTSTIHLVLVVQKTQPENNIPK